MLENTTLSRPIIDTGLKDSGIKSNSNLPANNLSISLNNLGSTEEHIIIIKIWIPAHGIQKAIRCNTQDTVWALKKQLMEKVLAEIPNVMNYGFFIPGALGKLGTFMDEKKEFSFYKPEQNVRFKLDLLILRFIFVRPRLNLFSSAKWLCKVLS